MHATLVLTLGDGAECATTTMSLEADLPETGPKVLDHAEQTLLTLFHDLMRSGFCGFGTRLARQRAEAAQADRGGRVVECSQPYRVDFLTYEIHDGDQVLWTPVNPESDSTAFAALGPREYYHTTNFRELLLTFASGLSMRDTAHTIQRIRHAEHGRRTPMTTAAAIVEREGLAVQARVEPWTAHTLHAEGFADSGIPAGDTVVPAPLETAVCLPPETVEAARITYNADRPPTLQIPEAALHDVYEQRERMVSISIDDVSVKKQKAHRQTTTEKAAPAESSSAAASRPDTLKRLHHPVAHVQSPNGHYLWTGRNTFAVLRRIIAFLCHHPLWANHGVQCFVDGARDLHAAIYERLGWRKVRLILDGFHLEEKCKVDLSLALKGRKIRNTVLDDLIPLLWLGRLDDAIARLRAIPVGEIKNSDSVDQLIGYVERNRSHIPCYAVREALGLRNSSNAGEKAKDLCVARRQKHNGMSWSEDRSVALTSATALIRNHALRTWCEHDRLEFKWVA